MRLERLVGRFVSGSSATLVLLAATAALSACQASDTLSLAPDAPLGQPGLTGQTPRFEANPTGATAQLTADEKADIRTDLQAASAPAERQAAADNVGAYRAGVTRLQQEGDALTEDRLRRIQGGDTSSEPIQ